MTSKQPQPPERGDSPAKEDSKPGAEPGTNEVEHEPDPHAKPIPDGSQKYVPRSPFTTGNY